MHITEHDINLQPDYSHGLCTIRIGVFFDGTGLNGNALKDEYLETFTCSNVYRLFQYYQSNINATKGQLSLKVYVEGIGTRDNMPDSIYSMFTGGEDIWGKYGYGPDSKLNMCSARIADQLDKLLTVNDVNQKTVNIELDLFGFSRGAVLARHVANLIYEKNALITDRLRTTCGAHGAHFNEKPVVNFLGLFDTVGSFMSMSVIFDNPHETGTTGNLKVYVPQGAVRNAFQLNALHECRYNFALYSFSGLYPEMTLAGAHSDIGGGYPEIMDEVKDLTTYKTIGFLKRAKTRVDEELDIVRKSKTFHILTRHIRYRGWEDAWCIATSKRHVKGHLQFIAFLAMLNIAQKCGCVFESGYEKYEVLLPENLHGYKDQVLLNAQKACIGQAADIDKAIIDNVTDEYVHLSASWRTIFERYHDLTGKTELVSGHQYADKQTSLDFSVLKNFWPDRPEENWKRKIFK